MRKYIKCFSILIVLFILFTQIPVYAYDVPQSIKIGLLYDSESPQSVTIKSDGGLSFGIENSGTSVPMGNLNSTDVTVAKDSQYHISLDTAFDNFDAAKAQADTYSSMGIPCYPVYLDWKFYVYSGFYSDITSAQTAVSAAATKLSNSFSVIEPFNNSYIIKNNNGNILTLFRSTADSLILFPGNNMIQVNKDTYRGSIIFFSNGQNMNVINLVNMEEYLYSVVAKEMSPSWPIEALKAQAVAARTFAVKNMNKYPGKGFNLTDTTNDQVYYGMSAENENSNRAVDETQGKIILYNDSPIEALYSATSGGSTESSKYVWGGDYPYLVSVEDPYEPQDKASYYNWDVTLTKADIKQLLSSKNIDIGDVVDIKTLEFSPEGRVTKLQIIGTQGTKEYTNDSCRTFFGGKLKSQYYTVQRPDYFTVLSANGREDASFSGACILSQNGKDLLDTGTTSAPILSLNGVSTLSTAIDGFIFTGKGYGHGVGMSQWGAYGMAQAGFTYDKILRYYYTGVTIS